MQLPLKNTEEVGQVEQFEGDEEQVEQLGSQAVQMLVETSL
jgi:hypothetical protein